MNGGEYILYEQRTSVPLSGANGIIAAPMVYKFALQKELREVNGKIEILLCQFKAMPISI